MSMATFSAPLMRIQTDLGKERKGMRRDDKTRTQEGEDSGPIHAILGRGSDDEVKDPEPERALTQEERESMIP